MALPAARTTTFPRTPWDGHASAWAPPTTSPRPNASDPSSSLQRGERRQTGAETETGMSRQGGLRCVPHHPSSPCPPVEDGPDASTVRAVPVHVEPGG